MKRGSGRKASSTEQNDKDALNPPRPDAGSNPTVNFRKQKRSHQTHRSLTDAEARLFKKSRGAEARLGYLANLLTANRHGLVLDVGVTQATGTAERDAPADMLAHQPASKRVTVGADRGYDTRGFVRQLREMKVTPHVAQNTSNHSSAIDGRTTRHEGYSVSQRKRKRVEKVFGWVKTVALQRKPGSGASSEQGGCLPSRPQHTTWSGCGHFKSRPHRPSQRYLKL